MKTKWVVIAILVVSIGSLGQGSYIQAKAKLAQWLLWDAWEETLADSETVRPWPWADIWPQARMKFVSAKPGDSNPFILEVSEQDLIVLNESSGQGLAFGPGVISGSAQPGEDGWLMIAAHNDTHFRFLQHAAVGDDIAIQDVKGQWHRYRIDELRIVDSKVERLPEGNEISEPGLILVTCYPFDLASNAGPDRFVALANYQGLDAL